MKHKIILAFSLFGALLFLAASETLALSASEEAHCKTQLRAATISCSNKQVLEIMGVTITKENVQNCINERTSYTGCGEYKPKAVTPTTKGDGTKVPEKAKQPQKPFIPPSLESYF